SHTLCIGRRRQWGIRDGTPVPPMVRLDVSPEVVFTATPSLFNLDGKVDVPWARIVVNEVPESAVGVSSDEVMLDKNLKPIKQQSASIPINSNLTSKEGKKVGREERGKKGGGKGERKGGKEKEGEGPNGQRNITDGRVHAYGQDLIVRKGELLFSGPPDQPLLNIDAIRTPDATAADVIAGVRVTGSADQPKAALFSAPFMSQHAALSYLLRGPCLSRGQSDSAA
ncbi:translocation/assembly module TamB domain-containing protein, partial [Acinetobacter baumannii]|nr:translocation/assembly module TamB domain-containing protein [Acinetobacter baumannii]